MISKSKANILSAIDQVNFEINLAKFKYVKSIDEDDYELTLKIEKELSKLYMRWRKITIDGFQASK